MSTPTAPATDPVSADADLALFARPRRAWRWWLLALVLLVGAAVAVQVVAHPFDKPKTSGSMVDNAQATSTATITRQTLAAQTQQSGTLGYAGSYAVVNQAAGTLTSLPDTGSVLTQGQVLYRVDGNPVVLLYGATPAYRSLAEAAEASDVTGADVAELNADLVALGYATGEQIPAGSDDFTWETKQAVQALQAHLGYPSAEQTGSLTLGQAVFLPGPARITTVTGTLGTQAHRGQPVMTATSTRRVVTLNIDTALQGQIKVGDTVGITLPNNSTTPGVVSSIGKVAAAPAQGSQNSSPTINVQITPSNPKATGSFDQAPVTVNITTATVPDALTVPVTALLALAGGGYAVEVVDADATRRLVPVQLGLFDSAKGDVEVSGSRVSAGQRVVVPSP